MNYIVFDLEWNQCPYGKNREVRELPFEIIEIGAVKLDADRNYVDSYERIVRPSVYKTLNYRTREIVHMDAGTLKKGMWFPDAVREFLSWAGHDSVFCTWGTVDLTELQRNMNYYHLLHLLKGPLHYYDVQKLFALTFETRKDRRALEYAVDFLKIEDSGEFHQALDDAVYTAKVLSYIPDEVISENFSIDCFQNPKNRQEEIRIRYGTYEKFVSREFATKELVMEDREVAAIRCFTCHKNAKRKIKWFSDNGRNHFAVGYCEEHGYVKCKVRVRKAADGAFFAIKTTKMSDVDEVEKIKDKQNGLRIRRHKKEK